MILENDVDRAEKIAQLVNQWYDSGRDAKIRAIPLHYAFDLPESEKEEFYEVVRDLGYKGTSESDGNAFISDLIVEGTLAGLFQ